MRKNLLITAVILIASVFTISAQDSLKVNFKPSGSVNETGWDSVLVADKTDYGSGAQTFFAFDNTPISVEPVWLSSPQASNTRSIARTSNGYKGSLQNMLSTYIAVDTKHTNDCDAVGVKISGLPAGKYIFNSYHHDFRDQLGSFTVSVTVNGSEVESVDTPMMISHSIDYETFVATYGALEEAKSEEYIKHFVVASLDSVTQFTSGEIVSSGKTDEIIVSFTSEIEPNADMSENEKLILINGFTLIESKATDISTPKATLSPEFKVLCEMGGRVLVTSDSQMANVKLFNVAGQLIEEINNPGDIAEFSNLRKGLYIVNVGVVNGGSSSKKIITK